MHSRKKAVLYTHDMEPITVIDLPSEAWQNLASTGLVRVLIRPPLVFSRDMANMPLKIVTIYAERFIYKTKPHLMLFTSDEVDSLLLQSAFLPGQLSSLQELEREAFYEGFLHAIQQTKE